MGLVRSRVRGRTRVGARVRSRLRFRGRVGARVRIRLRIRGRARVGGKGTTNAIATTQARVLCVRMNESMNE